MPDLTVMPTTTYLGKLLHRHHEGGSENAIRMAFRDYLLHAGIVSDVSEITFETSRSEESQVRVGLYVRGTYVEFKKDMVRSGPPILIMFHSLTGSSLTVLRRATAYRAGSLLTG